MKRHVVGVMIFLALVCTAAQADSISRYQGIFTSVGNDNPNAPDFPNLVGVAFKIFTVDATGDNLLPADDHYPPRYCYWFGSDIDPLECAIAESEPANEFIYFGSRGPFYTINGVSNDHPFPFDGYTIQINGNTVLVSFFGGFGDGNDHVYFSGPILYESNRQITAADTPEPGSFLLTITGILGLAGFRLHRVKYRT